MNQYFLNKSIGERFTKALEIVYKGKPNHILSCVEDTGISQPSISRAKKSNKMNPSITKFAKQKGISLSWLEFGNGDMFVNNKNISTSNQVVEDLNKKNKKTSIEESLAPDILNMVDMLKDIDKLERRKVLRFIMDL